MFFLKFSAHSLSCLIQSLWSELPAQKMELPLYLKYRETKIKETCAALGVDLRRFEFYGPLFSKVQSVSGVSG